MSAIGSKLGGIGLGALVICSALLAAVTSEASAAVGDVSYRHCVTGESPGTADACTAIPGASPDGIRSGLHEPTSLAISPDGRSAYAVTPLDDAIAHFDRDPSTGALAYRGCITGQLEAGPGGTGACNATASATPEGSGSGLDELQSVAVSPDGRSFYVAAGVGAAVAHFDRDPRTGALAYVGCISGDRSSGAGGTGACTLIPSASAGGDDSGLAGLREVVVSADGASLYAAALGDSAIARFDRAAATGTLGYRGCISGEADTGPAGTSACALIASASTDGADSGLQQPSAVQVSPDGGSVYVAAGGDDAVGSFARDAGTGALAYTGCVSGESESGPAGSDACAASGPVTASGVGSGLDLPFALALSPDSRSLYAVSLRDDAITRFDRDPASGALSEAGCISGRTGSGPPGTGACTTLAAASPDGSGSGLDALTGVTVSPDGESVYTTSLFDDALGIFARERDSGAISHRGCSSGALEIGASGSGGCVLTPTASPSGTASGLNHLSWVVVSSDGRFVYTAAELDDSVAWFAREAPSAPGGAAPPAGGGPAGDTAPPDTRITKGPKRRTAKRRARFRFTSSEPNSSFECRLDRRPFRPCTTPLRRKVKRAKHTLRVRAIDATGNLDPTPARRRWRVVRTSANQRKNARPVALERSSAAAGTTPIDTSQRGARRNRARGASPTPSSKKLSSPFIEPSVRLPEPVVLEEVDPRPALIVLSWSRLRTVGVASSQRRRRK